MLDNASEVDFEGFGMSLTIGFGAITFSVIFVCEITGASVVSCVKTFSVFECAKPARALELNETEEVLVAGCEEGQIYLFCFPSWQALCCL